MTEHPCVTMITAILLLNAVAQTSYPDTSRPGGWSLNRSVLSESAHQERRLLTWASSTDSVATVVLDHLDPAVDPSGDWIYGFGAPYAEDDLVVRQVEGNHFVVFYWHTECTMQYYLNRHAAYSNGVLTLERPIGGWNDTYDQLLAVTWSNETLLVPRRIAEDNFIQALGTNSILREMRLWGFRKTQACDGE